MERSASENEKLFTNRKRKRTKGSTKKIKVSTKRKRRKLVKDDYDDDIDNEAGDDAKDDGDIVQDDGDISQNVDEGGPYNCDKCKYVGRIKMHLLRHQKNQHAEKAEKWRK